MTYTKLLNGLIERSGLSNKEIVERCKDAGEKITTNYLSILKNNPERTASDSLSRALAKVCGAAYEDVLVVQAYLDKAPQIILEFLNEVFQGSKDAAESLIEVEKDKIDKEMYKAFKDQLIDHYENLSLAEFICESKGNLSGDIPEMTKQIQSLENTVNSIRMNDNVKWILIPLAQDADIKYLSNSEVDILSDYCSNKSR